MSVDRATGFGDLLRRYRQEAALSQEGLAAQAGLSARGISDLERGARRMPRLETVRMLADALALGPETRAALLAARGSAAEPAGDGAPAETGSPPLPVPLTPLIGREVEVAAAVERLHHPDVRLVTLTGPGGVGKTRLALAVAAEVVEAFADGAAFIELAPVADPGLVALTVAQALGVRLSGRESPGTALAQVLRDRRSLLVLDNFEHVLAAAPFVADLLAACPGLTVLATSRIRLRLRGEREVVVPPLATPDADHPPTTPEAIGEYEAVRLFVARAHEAQPSFALTSENAAKVAGICVRLDGLPLAIELAATRVKLLPIPALLGRLERRLPLLTGGARDLPARQQTLRATITWSYDLLAPEEQQVFRRLSVFVGGCTLEAAAAVAGDDGELLDVISSLVEHSLLRAEEGSDGDIRFWMLETIRDYGLERLEASSEAEGVRAAHAAHFLALAEDLRSKIEGSAGQAALARLEEEHPNLWASLGWAVEQGADQVETSLRLAAALWKFWLVRGHVAEGRPWLERVLAIPGDALPEVRAEVYYAAGSFAENQSDLARATVLGEELLAHAQSLPKPASIWWGVVTAGSLLGRLALAEGNLDRAEALFEDVHAGLRRVADAHPLSEHVAAFALSSLGRVDLARGDHGRALERTEAALDLWRRRGDQWGMAIALETLGNTALAQGELERAAQHLSESLRLFSGLEDAGAVASLLADLAHHAAVCRRPERAARLFGAANALRDRVGIPWSPDERRAHEPAIAALRQALDEETFARVWAGGRRLPVEDAVAEVLAATEPEPEPSAPAVGDGVPEHQAHGLSPRELEVLRLLTAGKTDQQIADALFISRRTVTSHVSTILGKLGVESRTAAAAQAVRHGLS